MKSSVLRYWGKADEKYIGSQAWHPLAYHCLDVAAVAEHWRTACPSLRRNFLAAFACETSQGEKLRAWVQFFVALHDLGKFDLRFQLKAPAAVAAAWRSFEKKDHGLSHKEIAEFDHGHAGIAWAQQEYRTWIKPNSAESAAWEHWQPWLAAVTGHHGDFYPARMDGLVPDTDEALIENDRESRHAFVDLLASLFLQPAGLSLHTPPPPCSIHARALLAGFCAVCDWIGSNTEVFDYRAPDTDLSDYYNARLAQLRTSTPLARFGLLASVSDYGGVDALLNRSESPRGVQTEIDALPATPGLTLIEAPTGSGKTEAALAYAWRLLDAGVADSIVFALPTQATANAMLRRVESFAGRVFGNASVVLAHGKRQFNEAFQKLADSGRRTTAQGEVEATVQCAAWLASSRKRVFLGQVGVCTVDQVLLSVLPVRHKFVRGFGLAKSVLIVDEVHAYDAYMHGLLGEVLRQQKAAGGSAILLSATLPANLRAKLLQTWDASGQGDAPYPALWHATSGIVIPRTVSDAQQPKRREVGIECLKLVDAFPDTDLIERIIKAAESGALVAVVVNLVSDAQRLARHLRCRTQIDVDIFHSRFSFDDRKRKEDAVMALYGRHAPRVAGRILVATQVVEQSLDIDFDWMLTQICPVDLLFQRLGRLHRHAGKQRPSGYESPRCTVLSVDGDDYGLHKLIYGNTRVLWRTEQLVTSVERIVFPKAYRDWIERVYTNDVWDDEPETIYGDYLSWRGVQEMREADALKLATMPASNFRDEDERITGLTRDGEMSLTVLPVQPDGRLLNGQSLADLSERELAEALNLNAVPAPASWHKHLRDRPFEKKGPLAGVWQLTLNATAPGTWSALNGKFHYSEDFGLEIICNEPA